MTPLVFAFPVRLLRRLINVASPSEHMKSFKTLLLGATFLGAQFLASIPSAQAAAASPEVPTGNVTFSLWGIATQPWQIMIDDFMKTPITTCQSFPQPTKSR